MAKNNHVLATTKVQNEKPQQQLRQKILMYQALTSNCFLSVPLKPSIANEHLEMTPVWYTFKMKTTSIKEYISGFPKETQMKLKEMRSTISAAAPEAVESINYGMPTFKLNGNLVHFAAFKNHIGFYPAPSAITHFSKELSKYKTAKGSIQFPLDKPLPLTLVKKITQFRVKENQNLHKK